MNLLSYKSKNRVVMIFTPSAADARFVRQLAIFKEKQKDMDERDIVVLQVVGPAEPRLRSEFRVNAADFAIILIGKDGSEKHRWKDVAPIDQLNHRIDRMPMRRNEMRDKQGSKPATDL